MSNYYELAGGLDVLDMMPPEERYIFAKWNVVKYVVRAGRKTENRYEDLAKAGRYLTVMMVASDEMMKGAE